MTENKKPTNKKNKINIDTKKMGLDIDKREYQEIVLSQSNQHDRGYFKRDLYNAGQTVI